MHNLYKQHTRNKHEKLTMNLSLQAENSGLLTFYSNIEIYRVSL